MFRKDRDKYSRGILSHVNENIPSKVLHLYSTPDDNEDTSILLEFSIKGLKYFFIVVYKAPSQKEKYFMD